MIATKKMTRAPRVRPDLRMLGVEKLLPTVDNRRRKISKASVESLAKSIAKDGVIQPIVVRAYFVGATLEAGNAWRSREDVRTGALRTGMSLFVGADTALGPLYFALTHAPLGQTGVVLFIGRP